MMIFVLFFTALSSVAASRDLVTNLTREADGAYFTDIEIGFPPQRFSVILDTGSDDLAVPCAGCTTCGKQHRTWNFSTSLSAQTSNTTFEVRYMEGSYLNASLMYDDVRVDDASVFSYPVGCIRHESKMFRLQEADGIFGLRETFLNFAGAFSMCYRTRKFDVGLPPRAREYTWIKRASSVSFHVHLVRISNVSATGKLALFDSGCTDLILPRAYHTPKGLCRIEFQGAPTIELHPCVPPDRIAIGADVILGTSFFRHIPRIAFTHTHVGLGLNANPACEENEEEAHTPIEPTLVVFIAYALALIVGTKEFIL